MTEVHQHWAETARHVNNANSEWAATHDDDSRIALEIIERINSNNVQRAIEEWLGCAG